MKKHKALEQIGSMTGVVKLSDIIKIIMQIDNFKVDTLKNLKKAKCLSQTDHSIWEHRYLRGVSTIEQLK